MSSRMINLTDDEAYIIGAFIACCHWQGWLEEQAQYHREAFGAQDPVRFDSANLAEKFCKSIGMTLSDFSPAAEGMKLRTGGLNAL